MAKKKLRLGQQIKPQQQTVASSKRNEQESPAPQPGQFWSMRGFRLQALIVLVLSLAFYCNSFLNEYALDDGIVIVKNEYVQEGTSGIFDILTKDAYDSYYRQLNSSNELKGGRYRPLSIVTFAVEQEFMGSLDKDSVKAILQQNMLSGIGPEQKEKINHEMHVRHVLNVVWYILSLLALLYFLRYIVFRGNPLMALIAAVIFTIHPIHTEVVANVKSRDEIMSLLFICLTFIFTFKARNIKRNGYMELQSGVISWPFYQKNMR
jgi:protein O-mannosyl-transferase